MLWPGRAAVFGLAGLFCGQAQAELLCPDPQQALNAALGVIFEDISDVWHIFPAEPAFAIIAPLYGREAEAAASANVPFIITPTHFKVISSGLIELDFVGGPSISSGTEFPALQVTSRFNQAELQALGADASFGQHNGYDMVAFRTQLSVTFSEVQSSETIDDGTKLVVDGHVVVEGNAVVAPYLARIGVSRLGSSVRAVASCADPQTDFLGNQLIKLHSARLLLESSHGRIDRRGLQ